MVLPMPNLTFETDNVERRTLTVWELIQPPEYTQLKIVGCMKWATAGVSKIRPASQIWHVEPHHLAPVGPVWDTTLFFPLPFSLPLPPAGWNPHFLPMPACQTQHHQWHLFKLIWDCTTHGTHSSWIRTWAACGRVLDQLEWALHAAPHWLARANTKSGI